MKKITTTIKLMHRNTGLALQRRNFSMCGTVMAEPQETMEVIKRKFSR